MGDDDFPPYLRRKQFCLLIPIHKGRTYFIAPLHIYPFVPSILHMKKSSFIFIKMTIIILLSQWNFGYLIADDAEAPNGIGLSFLPFALYTPETRIAGGIGGIYTFRSTEDQKRPNSITLSAKYTQNKQYAIELIPDIYLKAENYRLKLNILYQKFPLEFYGIGNSISNGEDYTPKEFKLGAILRRKIFEALNLGVQYEFTNIDIVEIIKNGLLESGNIPGSQGGKNSGIGLILEWDSRNRIFSATDGSFYQISLMTYKNFLGSNYDFSRYILDLRHYLLMFSSHTLSFQGLLKLSKGNPPFQKLALMGGRYSMRGYYEGQYRDKNMAAFQIEYRVIPIWWRIGIVGFFGLGGINNKVSSLKFSELKLAGGLGFRYQFDRGEGVNLRADFAYGDDSSGYYLTIFEAF